MGLIDTPITERLEHPYEPGEWVTIRPLLGTEMDQAKEAKVKHTLNLWGDSLEVMAGMQSKTRVKQPDSFSEAMSELAVLVSISPINSVLSV